MINVRIHNHWDVIYLNFKDKTSKINLYKNICITMISQAVIYLLSTEHDKSCLWSSYSYFDIFGHFWRQNWVSRKLEITFFSIENFQLSAQANYVDILVTASFLPRATNLLFCSTAFLGPSLVITVFSKKYRWSDYTWKNKRLVLSIVDLQNILVGLYVQKWVCSVTSGSVQSKLGVFLQRKRS